MNTNFVQDAMHEVENLLKNAFTKAMQDGKLPEAEIPNFTVEIPAETTHGDFASNAAMVSARTFRNAPVKIANILKEEMDFSTARYIDRVEIAGPGFINFFVSPLWFADIVSGVLAAKENYGRSDYGKGEKVMIEFVSANPTGPMHMGNARGGAIGDCLAAAMDACGYNVTREFYINDAGNQIEKFGLSLEARYLQIFKGEDAVEFPEDGYHGEDIKERAQQYADVHGDSLLNVSEQERRQALVDFALPKNIEKLRTDLEKYRIVYDVWFPESTLHQSGAVKAVVDDLTKRGLTYEKDGAVWYKATEFGGEKDEVLIRANGNPTYFTADIAYHKNKFADRHFDRVINVWGADHHGHVARLKGAMDAIGLDGSKLDIVLMQLVRLMKDGEPYRMSKRTGKCFTVEPIHVNHSIPDSVAFAIDSPAGTIIQTGDFKIDYTPLACGVTDLTTLSEYGQKGVLALLSDSTNAERPGFTATEQKVAAGVRNLFARARNKRIIIATFASNIYRVQQIIDLAVEDGRKVAFSGRSMVNNTAMAQELGYMHIPEGTLISVDELNQYPPEQVVLITTGSQGEPLSALSRMASCSHRQVRVGPGDFIIISANPIPGNEKSVTKIVNGLLLLGAEVIYESMYDVHVSGHACQEEQKLMLTLTRPKYFLPVHGEYKQLKKHALTAASLGIPTSNILIAENGSNVILSRDEIKLGEPVTAGAVMVDGLGVGDVGNVVLRDRKHLSEDGLVIIVATVDSKTGKVLAGPDLVSRGFVYVRENESLMDGAQSIVENALDRCVEEHVRDWNSVKTRVREALSSYIYRRTKRSPMILPILMEV